MYLRLYLSFRIPYVPLLIFYFLNFYYFVRSVVLFLASFYFFNYFVISFVRYFIDHSYVSYRYCSFYYLYRFVRSIRLFFFSLFYFVHSIKRKESKMIRCAYVSFCLSFPFFILYYILFIFFSNMLYSYVYIFLWCHDHDFIRFLLFFLLTTAV